MQNIGSSSANHGPASMAVDEGEEYSFTTEATQLGDLDDLIRSRGLDPADWRIISANLKEWDSATKDGGSQRLKLWHITLKRAPHLVLARPAVHVPPVKRTPLRRDVSRSELIVVEGDHQCPYHDERLHSASLHALEELYTKHHLTEHVFLGDTGDYPTISRHASHPAAMATVNEVIQATYQVLRDKAEAAPNVKRYKLKGNHDWRLESELLAKVEHLYGIKPADTRCGPERPALSLERLLHLDSLGIELVEDPRGWEHAEIELVGGIGGLVVRHGWLTGQNTAKRSLLKRGRSLIVGHTHSREHVYQWDASAGLERQAVVAGTMSLCRDQRFPHYAVSDDWLQGFVTVTRWPDGNFGIEHARWDGRCLRWRDRCWTP